MSLLSQILPTTLGTRPRLALEIRPEGVVAARADDAQALLSAVASGLFAEGTLVPGLKAGNVLVRPMVVAAVRKALEAVALKERQVTLVVPDGAVRVLLLDFDALPAKLAEALPIVRFRLKKLLPFDADEALVTFQVMSTTKTLVRVLAVAAPREVLAEYEGVVREAGFEPGAVLPSTLAAVAGLVEAEAATLLVNAGETSVTTAIVQGAVLLLHRTVDLAAEHEYGAPLATPAESAGRPLDGEGAPHADIGLPLVSAEESAGEWAMQPPVSGYGVIGDEEIAQARARGHWDEAVQAVMELNDEERVAQAVHRGEIDRAAAGAMHVDATPAEAREYMLPAQDELTVEQERLAAAAREVAQAVSVAAAYFEDTLLTAPATMLAAGTMGAQALAVLLHEAGFTDGEIAVRETVEPAMLTGGATTVRVPRGWMAGVRGALRS